jgi:hypothetical protein
VAAVVAQARPARDAMHATLLRTGESVVGVVISPIGERYEGEFTADTTNEARPRSMFIASTTTHGDREMMLADFGMWDLKSVNDPTRRWRFPSDLDVQVLANGRKARRRR